MNNIVVACRVTLLWMMHETTLRNGIFPSFKETTFNIYCIHTTNNNQSNSMLLHHVDLLSVDLWKFIISLSSHHKSTFCSWVWVLPASVRQWLSSGMESCITYAVPHSYISIPIYIYGRKRQKRFSLIAPPARCSRQSRARDRVVVAIYLRKSMYQKQLLLSCLLLLSFFRSGTSGKL